MRVDRRSDLRWPVPGRRIRRGRPLPNGSVGKMVLVRRYATSTLPGSPAAMAGKKCVPRSLTGLTRYALAALPGTRPPPPSQVAPPSLDQTTYVSYSHEVSD